MPYNREATGETLRGFRGVVAQRTAHCLEAALFSATVLELHGYPPTVLSFESKDGLDHVLHAVRAHKDHGPYGAVGRSRDEGLHGRRMVYRGPRTLAQSYVEPYVDLTGRITSWIGAPGLDTFTFHVNPPRPITGSASCRYSGKRTAAPT